MEYVRLGRTGLKVSRLILGCMTYGDPKWSAWVLDEAGSRPFIRRALDLGVTTFDTADMYSNGASEEILGRAIKDWTTRQHMVIATKLHNPMGPEPNNRGLSRKHIFEAVDASLRRLQTDYIDLYQIHRFDYETPLEETLDALNDVVRSGRVRYLGASSMFAWQFMKALGLQRRHGWAPFVSMQNQYSLLYREEEREMLPLCREEGIGVIPWSPLARGYLAGNRHSSTPATNRAGADTLGASLFKTEADRAIIAAVDDVARKLGRSMAQVAYAWAATRTGVTTPIYGISKLPQFDDALKSLTLRLDPEDITKMEAPYVPRPIAGHS